MRVRTPTDVGLLVRDRRRALGLDQRALAERVGVSRQWVIGLEKGKRRAELALVLRTLEALGIGLRTDEPAHAASTEPAVPATPTSAGAARLDRVLAAHRRRGTSKP
jgi:HTH-type transcriptional regulator/antitoxin HipB